MGRSVPNKGRSTKKAAGAHRRNLDGSVDLYFGPQAPTGKEPNWIPTAHRGFFMAVRLHGPEKAVFNRSFRLPDIEKVA